MSDNLIENSLKNIKSFDRFKLVHEAVKLAKAAPMDASDKPVIWALKKLAEEKKIDEKVE